MDSMTIVGDGQMGKYPHLFPPPGFTPIDRNGIFSFNGNPGDSQVLETIKEIGQGNEGWLRLLGLESADFFTTFFTILRNGQPMKDYTRLLAPIGSTSTPREAFIYLPGNYTYSLQVTCYNAAAVNVSLRWTLFGWYYPLQGRK